MTAREGDAGTESLYGFIGLAGGVAELTRDAFESYSSPCWAAATLVNPTCDEQFAPIRPTRGGGWSDQQSDPMRVSDRGSLAATFGDLEVGFRVRLCRQVSSHGRGFSGSRPRCSSPSAQARPPLAEAGRRTPST